MVSARRESPGVEQRLKRDMRWEKRLQSYAAAASTAGVSVLALTKGADAKVVYTHVHHLIGPNAKYLLDLNHDGNPDFRLANIYVYLGTAALSVNGQSGNGFAASKDGYGPTLPFALKKGEKIGQPQPFQSRSGDLVKIVSTSRSTFSWGKWVYATNRYLGLRFRVKGQTHYGWARLSVYGLLGPPYVRSTITGYAYETVPNKPIIAGDEHGAANFGGSTIQPASLGALAAGANGLSVWRKK